MVTHFKCHLLLDLTINTKNSLSGHVTGEFARGYRATRRDTRDRRVDQTQRTTLNKFHTDFEKC